MFTPDEPLNYKTTVSKIVFPATIFAHKELGYTPSIHKKPVRETAQAYIYRSLEWLLILLFSLLPFWSWTFPLSHLQNRPLLPCSRHRHLFEVFLLPQNRCYRFRPTSYTNLSIFYIGRIDTFTVEIRQHFRQICTQCFIIGFLDIQCYFRSIFFFFYRIQYFTQRNVFFIGENSDIS